MEDSIYGAAESAKGRECRAAEIRGKGKRERER